MYRAKPTALGDYWHKTTQSPYILLCPRHIASSGQSRTTYNTNASESMGSHVNHGSLNHKDRSQHKGAPKRPTALPPRTSGCGKTHCRSRSLHSLLKHNDSSEKTHYTNGDFAKPLKWAYIRISLETEVNRSLQCGIASLLCCILMSAIFIKKYHPN
jgi:hypothetical protein